MVAEGPDGNQEEGCMENGGYCGIWRNDRALNPPRPGYLVRHLSAHSNGASHWH